MGSGEFYLDIDFDERVTMIFLNGFEDFLLIF